MNLIWKKVLHEGLNQSISIPRGSEFLYVANQNGELTLWFMFSYKYKEDLVDRALDVVSTGWQIYPGRKYVGTAIVGSLVWHVFSHS